MFNSISSPDWSRRWLQLSVLALAISGVFSIILVFARTPQLIAHFPWMKELFSVSLVIHVDLSVLVWFLGITGLLWSLLPHRPSFHYANAASWGCVLAGILCMTLSPLTGEWEVIKSNYIPVITNALFFAGLALLLSGMLIGMVQTLFAQLPKEDLLALGVWTTAPVLLVALACFYGSSLGIPPDISGHAFYENLFWAGGHVLQFVYVQIMLIAWLVLASQIGLRTPPKKLLLFVLFVGPLASLSAFVPYLLYDVMSQELMDAFSLQMNVALGIGGVWYVSRMVARDSVPFACANSQNDGHPVGGINRSTGSGKSAFKSALYTSFLLFIVGGAFGAAINGPNVRIPAHYHGSIVAVTLALMGLAYYLLPKLGGADVSRWKMARFQPWLYGIGQLLHISGLAWSGGYGVLRKSAGYAGEMTPQLKAAFGLIGGGGLLAIIGGLLFVIVMVKGFRRCDVVEDVK
jgi:cytochrome c oxidase subunit 1